MHTVLRFALLATAAAASSVRDILTTRPDLTTFASLLDHFEAWNIFETFPTDFTAMVPNDAAYEKLLKMGLDLKEWPANFTVPILRYHLLEGRIGSVQVKDENEPFLVPTALTVPNMTHPLPVKLFREAGEIQAESGLQLTAKVVEPDIEFAGGVLHVLESSLVAPHNFSATAWMNGLCGKFLQFMDETDMASELESLHDATLFIPNDEAWQRAESVLAKMNLHEKRALLRNHAIQGQVAYRSELSHRQTLKSVGGQALEIKVDEKGGITVEDAAVVRTDVLWYNGVAHMTDKVIMLEQVS